MSAILPARLRWILARGTIRSKPVPLRSFGGLTLTLFSDFIPTLSGQSRTSPIEGEERNSSHLDFELDLAFELCHLTLLLGFWSVIFISHL
jgi:hypothetical protein